MNKLVWAYPRVEAPVLPANIRLGWKGLSVANTLAFYFSYDLWGPSRVSQYLETYLGWNLWYQNSSNRVPFLDSAGMVLDN
jgi:hypothetical protein